jgi:hypothetical protein
VTYDGKHNNERTGSKYTAPTTVENTATQQNVTPFASKDNKITGNHIESTGKNALNYPRIRFATYFKPGLTNVTTEDNFLLCTPRLTHSLTRGGRKIGG